MKAFVLTACIFSIFSSASCQDSVSTFGNTNIKIVTTCYTPCTSPVTFINLHENESTSVQAAQVYLKEFGGTLMRLQHSGERNITFISGRKKYTLDPNRMFTDIGRKASLLSLGVYTDKAALEIKPLADEILTKYIDHKKLVVALHNNSDSAYSLLSYTVPEQEGMNAEKIFINEAMDSDDFVLTTDSSVYNALQQQGINVVLQSKNPKDDGSLSVYAYYKNIAYINIEAQHGHVEEQTRMLYALKEIIELYK